MGNQAKFRQRCAAEVFKPWPSWKQQSFNSLPRLRQESEFHGPDSFRFACKLNNFLTNQQHRIRDFQKNCCYHTYMPTGQTTISSISQKKIIHFGPLILIGSTHKFSAIFSIIFLRPGLYRILGTTIILLPAILLSKRFPLHPISVDWIYKNRN